MGPELSVVNLQIPQVTAAETRVNRATDAFAVEYQRGQGILSVFNRGRDRINGAVADLRQRVGTLAEFRARRMSSGGAPGLFPVNYSMTFADQYVQLSRDAVVATAEQGENSGWFGNIHSIYSQTGPLRLITGAGLAAYGYFATGGDAQTAMNFYESAAVIGGTGLIDSTRDAYLATTTRMAGAAGNVAESIRRWASMAEGRVTGDRRDFLNPYGQTTNDMDVAGVQLSNDLRMDLEAKIESEGIVRPSSIGGVADLRTMTSRVIQDYDLITPIVQARDTARTSRALRMGVAGLLIAGALAHHFLRVPEFQPAPNCGTVDFRSPDWINGAAVGNPDAHSLTGYAQARLLRHVNGSRPDFNSGAGWDQLRNLYEDDAIEFIVDGIRIALPAKNGANLRFLTSDLVEQVGPVLVADLCPGEIEEIARNAPRKTTGLRP